MKRCLVFLLVLAFLGGCSAGNEGSSGSEVSLLTGDTVSGIITKVNGNEITLDLVTMNQGIAPREETGEAGEEEMPPAGEAQRPQGEPGGSREDRGERQETGGGNRESRGGQGGPPGSGQLPSGMPSSGGTPFFGGGAGSVSGQRNYTRTGETALYQIPVGATVLTLTGTSRGFNSLSTDLLVTITFREDGVTPGQVQVIQSLS